MTEQVPFSAEKDAGPGPEYAECVEPDCKQNHFIYGGKPYYTKLPSQLVHNPHDPTGEVTWGGRERGWWA